MLNEKIRNFLESNEWLTQEKNVEYDKVIDALNIPMDSDFAEFHRFTTEVSFSTEKAAEVMNICWFSIYSDFELLATSLWENRPWGNLPRNFIPFSDYSGDSILLYDTVNQGVYYINDLEINELLKENLTPQWKTFSEFLEHYFDIE